MLLDEVARLLVDASTIEVTTDRDSTVERDVAAYPKIWVINSAPSDRRVVFAPLDDGTGVDDGPSFAVDGRRLVLTRCCPEGYVSSLWMINQTAATCTTSRPSRL
jgi:hypothetical protein